MLVRSHQGQSGPAHVVVLGNDKGGSGKSTLALHIAIALMKAGQRVATIDVDSRQPSLTRYVENRCAFARRTGSSIELPTHYGVTRRAATGDGQSELQQLVDAVIAVERSFDFIVIDTPGTDSGLMRLAHAMADTLLTPVNDSFLDLHALGRLDPASRAATGVSLYVEMVQEGRRRRRQFDGVTADWIVLRNRRSTLLAAGALTELSLRLGFRPVNGLAERVLYRELFPRGLTALDTIDEPGPDLGHLAAREETIGLVRELKLPLDERGRRRAANRAEWFAQAGKPLDVHDI